MAYFISKIISFHLLMCLFNLKTAIDHILLLFIFVSSFFNLSQYSYMKNNKFLTNKKIYIKNLNLDYSNFFIII